MGLSKRNFLYSIFISLLLITLVTGYFLFMLPSLYEAHMNEINYQSVIELHEAFMEKGSYEGTEVRNPTGCISVKIPEKGNELLVQGMNYRATLTIQDTELQTLMNAVGNIGNLTESQVEEFWKEVQDTDILGRLTNPENLGESAPFTIEIKTDTLGWYNQMSTDNKIHRVNDHLYVWESLANDSFNQYVSYIAMEMQVDGIVITTLPVMAPKINEIRPVVLGSLPMITVVVFLLVLLFSQMYSRKIVNPIITISHYTQSAMQASNFEMERLQVDSKDEIGTLAQSINEMHERLSESYMELKRKNNLLVDENKRQEVFLRASSHQLKTPIAAALLLTEGMIGEIGKYKDVKEYLPQVKDQLLSMKKIVDDILYLNTGVGEVHKEAVDVSELLEDLLKRYEIQIKNKKLTVINDVKKMIVQSDGNILVKVLDNLVSNAVIHSNEGKEIIISAHSECLTIINEGSHIEEELLPHIYEPFVSSSQGAKGHGLGLYVAAYYIQMMGHELSISNEEQGVKSEIHFGGNKTC